MRRQAHARKILQILLCSAAPTFAGLPPPISAHAFKDLRGRKASKSDGSDVGRRRRSRIGGRRAEIGSFPAQFDSRFGGGGALPIPPPQASSAVTFPPSSSQRPTIHSTLKKGERKEGKASFTVRTGRSETFGPFRLPRSRKERTKVSLFPVRTPPTLTAMRRNRSSTTLWESFGKLSLPAKRFSTAHVGRRKIFLASLRSFSTSLNAASHRRGHAPITCQTSPKGQGHP